MPESKYSSRYMPRVSIGLPVFNGEKYIKATLDSILAQDYPDFELIIMDNASTDQTTRICREYTAKDKRIRYYRNKINVGASKNFNLAFKFSSGKYFKWVAHDDLLAPEYLSKCVDILDRDPSIVLCHSKTGRIDEHGKLLGTYNYEIRSNSQESHERFADLIIKRWQPSWVLIFGLIRAKALRMTQLMGDYIESDGNLLAEISLIGRIYEIPEILFFRRHHMQSYTAIDWSTGYNYKDKMVWWTQTSKLSFPSLRKCLEYFKAVRRIPLKWSQRLLCYAQIVKWIAKRGGILIGADVGINLFGRSKLGLAIAPFVKRILDASRRRD